MYSSLFAAGSATDTATDRATETATDTGTGTGTGMESMILDMVFELCLIFYNKSRIGLSYNRKHFVCKVESDFLKIEIEYDVIIVDGY